MKIELFIYPQSNCGFDNATEKINFFFYSDSELLAYSLSKLVQTIVDVGYFNLIEVNLIHVNSINETVIDMLRADINNVFIFDLDSMFYIEKVKIISELRKISENLKSIALCNDQEYLTYYKFYSSLFEFVVRKKVKTSELEHDLKEIIDSFSIRTSTRSASNEYSSKHYFYMLTDKESAILKKILSGETNKKIATGLFISEKTVCSHRSRIYSKFGVRTLFDLYSRLKYESLIV